MLYHKRRAHWRRGGRQPRQSHGRGPGDRRKNQGDSLIDRMWGVRRISHLITWSHPSVILNSTHTYLGFTRKSCHSTFQIYPESDHISPSLFLVQLPSSLAWISAASSLVSLLPPTAPRGVLLKQILDNVPLLLKSHLWPLISHLLAPQALCDLPTTSFTSPTVSPFSLYFSHPGFLVVLESLKMSFHPRAFAHAIFLCLECFSPDSHRLPPTPSQRGFPV